MALRKKWGLLTQTFSLFQQVLGEEPTWSPATAYCSLIHALVQPSSEEDILHLGLVSPSLETVPLAQALRCREPECLESSGSSQTFLSFQAPCCGPGSWAQIISTLPGSWLQERLSGSFGITPCPTATDPVILKTLAVGKPSWWVYLGAVPPGKLSVWIWIAL